MSPTFPGGIVELSKLPLAKETRGTNYLYESWNLGSVALTTGKAIKNIPMKYDLYQNYLEVSTDRGVKVIYSENIKYFEWLNILAQKEIFYNVAEFDKKIEGLTGFLEIIMEGKLIFTSNKNVQYVAPHYNQALDAGNEQGRFILKENFYFVDEQNRINKLPKKKKDFYPIFGEDAPSIEEFVKATKFSLKDRDDLKKIFIYYNTLQSNN